MQIAAVVLAACATLALAGCEDKAKKLSSSEHLLAKQHEAWRNARESLRSSNPNLMYLRSVHIFLRGRTRRRVEKDYTRPDKQEVLAALDALKATYEADIMSRIDARSFQVTLRPGVTLAEVREAFEKSDAQYRRLEAMAAQSK